MKNDCDKFADDLSALIDGELSANWRAEIEAHLAGCGACRARVAELRQLSAGIANLPKMPTSPEFLEEVRRKISRGDEPQIENWWEQSIRSPWMVVPVRVAAVVVIFLGFVAVFAPLYNSHVNRVQRGQLAKAEKPGKATGRQAPVASTAVPTPRSKEMAASPPAAPAPAKLAYDRVDGLAKDEGEVSVAAGVVADKDQAGVETIIVEASDPYQVQAQANQMALALNGRVTTNPPQRVATRKLANSFYVELPARNAGSFRNQLLNQYVPANQRGLNWTQAIGVARDEAAEVQQFKSFGDVAGTLSNEPTSVLEIQVVTPAK